LAAVLAVATGTTSAAGLGISLARRRRSKRAEVKRVSERSGVSRVAALGGR
jgi:hypothetical protein